MVTSTVSSPRDPDTEGEGEEEEEEEEEEDEEEGSLDGAETDTVTTMGKGTLMFK